MSREGRKGSTKESNLSQQDKVLGNRGKKRLWEDLAYKERARELV